MLPSGITEALLAAGIAVDPSRSRRVGGGDINACYVVGTRRGDRLFVKTNEPDRADMFAAELDGLQELRNAGAVRVPEPLACGGNAEVAWLVMEFLELAPGSAAAGTRLGAALADQHRRTAAEFGWHRDNTIGSTLQRNVRRPSWLDFFAAYRLGFQLGLAAENGAGAELRDKGAELVANLPHYFQGYQPVASLLHGDLWGGNWAMIGNEVPVIFDPAVYYGDREADIAMTELFGGFPAGFYAAYDSAWPLDEGYRRRRDIYKLYHVLNHLNLFGGSYQRQAIALLDRLLAQV
jgi:fructosamine-3-kinase